MTKKIKWRLSKLPDPLELADLVKGGLLTKDEAREILFTEENDEDRDKQSLKEEIKFLRELVQKLSNNSRSEIIRTIEYIEKPYRKYDWWQPYQMYCSTGSDGQLNANSALYQTTTGLNTAYLSSQATTGGLSVTYSSNMDTDSSFTDVKTF